MSKTPDYKLVTIELETRFGKDQREDKYFTDYLEEYSIVWSVVEDNSQPADAWPKLQYMGGPISLTNMLREKFGFSQEEIYSQFPQIAEASN
jgi:hypothetical protein